MPRISRHNDLAKTGHACSTVAPVRASQFSVFANSRAVLRPGDKLKPHKILVAPPKRCVGHKAKVKKGDLDRKDIIGGAKNKRDSKRLMKKADEFVKETLKGFKRGGRAGFNKGSKDPVGKKKSKFPDFSGDGEVTQKDILMAKGVIPKPKNKKKVI